MFFHNFFLHSADDSQRSFIFELKNFKKSVIFLNEMKWNWEIFNSILQGVTGPHRQNDRDDRPCRKDNFFVKEHILANMSFLSYAQVSRCACHTLEPTDHWLMYADDIMNCAVSPHSVVAIRSAWFNAPLIFFSLGATTTVDWTRRICCSAVLADRCCDDIKHSMRHRADCLNRYCKNMPFSIKW